MKTAQFFKQGDRVCWWNNDSHIGAGTVTRTQDYGNWQSVNVAWDSGRFDLDVYFAHLKRNAT